MAGRVGKPEQICQLTEPDRGWPRLEAALRLIWRWRGVSKLEGALAKPLGGCFPQCVPPQLVERDAEAAHDLGDEIRLPLGRAAQCTLHEAVRRLGQ